MRPVGKVNETTLDSLGLQGGRSFGDRFDFGDDWWHQAEWLHRRLTCWILRGSFRPDKFRRIVAYEGQ